MKTIRYNLLTQIPDQAILLLMGQCEKISFLAWFLSFFVLKLKQSCIFNFVYVFEKQLALKY